MNKYYVCKCISVFLKFSNIFFLFDFLKYGLCGCLIDNDTVASCVLKYILRFLSTLQFKATALVTMYICAIISLKLAIFLKLRILTF